LHPELGAEAFGPSLEAPVTIDCKSQQVAVEALMSAIHGADGIGFLHGPERAGKSTVLRQLADDIGAESAIAIVDGAQVKPDVFLWSMLSQFGQDEKLGPAEDLLRTTSAFVVQETRESRAPILIVDNADQMYASTLRILGVLATLAASGRFALRMVFSSCVDYLPVLTSEGMTSIAGRAGDSVELGPMTRAEAKSFLHARLFASGVAEPEGLFPEPLCEQLFERASGWPGRLNECALAELGTSLPKAEDPQDTPGGAPRLTLSRSGTVIAEHVFKHQKVLIGRSHFADIVIDDRFASKCHALLMLYTDGLVLVDLNSANGTLVNSVPTQSALLSNNDIVSIGHLRIKVHNVPPPSERWQQSSTEEGTVRMKSLNELRLHRPKDHLAAIAERKTSQVE
jgi:type II secretory pathway predicted ATPase ExeA